MGPLAHFPGYQTEALLYSGPSTRVWRVRRGRARYALKEFLAARPLLRELASLTEVQHPHIVQCLDAGLSPEGGAFLVFELAGGSLRQKLSQGPLQGRQWLCLARQLLSGLAAIHARGLVHCDLKPENVLLFGRYSNHYKLSDLGLACRLAEWRWREPARGTPAYMAPEQFDGQATPRSDLYALGLLLFEAGCGQRPFSGSYSELRQLSSEQPVDLSNWPLEAWKPWLQRLLHKLPEHRPATAAQALHELDGESAPSTRPRSNRETATVPVCPPLGECLPVYRQPLEYCAGLYFLSRGSELQLWASLPGLSLILARQGGRWCLLPSGPPVQACDSGHDIWVTDGTDVYQLEPQRTRPRRIFRLSYPVEQLLVTPSLVVAAGSRRLSAFGHDGSRRWSVCLPHYWGPMPLAQWDSESLAVAVGPSPARLLRVRLDDGGLEQEWDLPAPCLALLAQEGTLSMILAEMRHFPAGSTGCWQLREQRLQRVTGLSGELSWARAHRPGFSLGKGIQSVTLHNIGGQMLARIPSTGQVCCDCWSQDGSHYAWFEQHQGAGSLRIAEILPWLKEAC